MDKTIGSMWGSVTGFVHLASFRTLPYIGELYTFLGIWWTDRDQVHFVWSRIRVFFFLLSAWHIGMLHWKNASDQIGPWGIDLMGGSWASLLGVVPSLDKWAWAIYIFGSFTQCWLQSLYSSLLEALGKSGKRAVWFHQNVHLTLL